MEKYLTLHNKVYYMCMPLYVANGDGDDVDLIKQQRQKDIIQTKMELHTRAISYSIIYRLEYV